MTDSPNIVAFMPWLWLERPVSVSSFTFSPFRDKAGLVPTALAGLTETFPVILSSYCDAQQRPRQSCVVLIDRSPNDPAKPWNLSENRSEAARWASSLLFLATWAANEYFTQLGSYVNDTNFQLYFQRFTDPPEYISLSYRRRDGHILYGGPKHGEIHSTMPLFASSSHYKVETDFLAALDAGDTSNACSVAGLKSVLTIVRLANTDNDVLTPEAEAALMGFAFEQYLDANGARDLAVKFDVLFSGYAKTTAGDAQATRPGIYPDPDPRFTDAQLSWNVAKMWMQEFYQYRSAVAHGSLSGRTWGWSPAEHLVMAAFVFPLIVKLRLAKEGFYSLSQEDEGRCRSVDTLLVETDWHAELGSSMNTKWQEIIRGHQHDIHLSAAVEKAVADWEKSNAKPNDSSETGGLGG